jgi:hypothetical protein
MRLQPLRCLLKSITNAIGEEQAKLKRGLIAGEFAARRGESTSAAKAALLTAEFFRGAEAPLPRLKPGA